MKRFTTVFIPGVLSMLLSTTVPEIYLALHDLYKEIFPKL